MADDNRRVARIEPLDWLRGALACAIMAYHVTGWSSASLDAGSVLGRLGIYGVTMFFVLSGLSMAIVYQTFVVDWQSSARFLVRRAFRILPLLCAAVLLAPGLERYPWTTVALNLTGAFGFVAPGSYINVGAWSIGNELVYYALTPALIVAYARRRAYGNALVAAAAAVWLLFAFVWLTPGEPLAWQWATYIHPFNNFFLYGAGFAIFHNVGALGRASNAAVGAASLALLALWPSQGDLISIVTGAERVVYCAASIGIVVFFYRSQVRPPRPLANALTTIGLATYGIYLLHPLVFDHLQGRLAPGTIPAATVALTMTLAIVAYRLFEAPLIRLGAKLTATPWPEPSPVRIKFVYALVAAVSGALVAAAYPTRGLEALAAAAVFAAAIVAFGPRRPILRRATPAAATAA